MQKRDGAANDEHNSGTKISNAFERIGCTQEKNKEFAIGRYFSAAC